MAEDVGLAAEPSPAEHQVSGSPEPINAIGSRNLLLHWVFAPASFPVRLAILGQFNHHHISVIRTPFQC